MTLLSDPWPEDPSEIREKVEKVRKTLALPVIDKAARPIRTASSRLDPYSLR